MTQVSRRLVDTHRFYELMDELFALAPGIGLTWIEIRTQGDAPMQQGMRTWGRYREEIKRALGDPHLRHPK